MSDNEISLIISDYVDGYDEDHTAVTLYIIKITNLKTKKSCKVKKRYSDFVALHSLLREKYPKIDHFNFPRKTIMNNPSVTTKSYRKEAFNNYLQILTTLMPSPEISEFLEPKVEYDHQYTIQRNNQLLSGAPRHSAINNNITHTVSAEVARMIKKKRQLMGGDNDDDQGIGVRNSSTSQYPVATATISSEKPISTATTTSTSTTTNTTSSFLSWSQPSVYLSSSSPSSSPDSKTSATTTHSSNPYIKRSHHFQRRNQLIVHIACIWSGFWLVNYILHFITCFSTTNEVTVDTDTISISMRAYLFLNSWHFQFIFNYGLLIYLWLTYHRILGHLTGVLIRKLFQPQQKTRSRFENSNSTENSDLNTDINKNSNNNNNSNDADDDESYNIHIGWISLSGLNGLWIMDRRIQITIHNIIWYNPSLLFINTPFFIYVKEVSFTLNMCMFDILKLIMLAFSKPSSSSSSSSSSSPNQSILSMAISNKNNDNNNNIHSIYFEEITLNTMEVFVEKSLLINTTSSPPPVVTLSTVATTNGNVTTTAIEESKDYRDINNNVINGSNNNINTAVSSSGINNKPKVFYNVWSATGYDKYDKKHHTIITTPSSTTTTSKSTTTILTHIKKFVHKELKIFYVKFVERVKQTHIPGYYNLSNLSDLLFRRSVSGGSSSSSSNYSSTLVAVDANNFNNNSIYKNMNMSSASAATADNITTAISSDDVAANQNTITCQDELIVKDVHTNVNLSGNDIASSSSTGDDDIRTQLSASNDSSNFNIQHLSIKSSKVNSDNNDNSTNFNSAKSSNTSTAISAVSPSSPFQILLDINRLHVLNITLHALDMFTSNSKPHETPSANTDIVLSSLCILRKVLTVPTNNSTSNNDALTVKSSSFSSSSSSNINTNNTPLYFNIDHENERWGLSLQELCTKTEDLIITALLQENPQSLGSLVGIAVTNSAMDSLSSAWQ